MITTVTKSGYSRFFVERRYSEYLDAPRHPFGIDALLRACDHLGILEQDDRDRWCDSIAIIESYSDDELDSAAATVKRWLDLVRSQPPTETLDPWILLEAIELKKRSDAAASQVKVLQQRLDEARREEYAAVENFEALSGRYLSQFFPPGEVLNVFVYKGWGFLFHPEEGVDLIPMCQPNLPEDTAGQ